MKVQEWDHYPASKPFYVQRAGKKILVKGFVDDLASATIAIADLRCKDGVRFLKWNQQNNRLLMNLLFKNSKHRVLGVVVDDNQK